jgi:hypothetical protein
MSSPVVFREITSLEEALGVLRLRHRIYYEKQAYGNPKESGLDLTPHEPCSRLFGCFRDREIVGGMRLVYRTEQLMSKILVGLQDTDWKPGVLPSEVAFDCKLKMGHLYSDLAVEIRRFTVVRGNGRVIAAQTLIAILGVLLAENPGFFLYSCRARMAAHFANFFRPRWSISNPRASGFLGFDFPMETSGHIGIAIDSPYISAAQAVA